MNKILNRFRRPKRSNKENIGSATDRHGLRVNFEDQAYRNDSEDEDCDYEGGGSEVTLKVPLNPYHVVTEPKTKRGPRSCPGAVTDHPRRFHDSNTRRLDHSPVTEVLNDSFRSEFITSRSKNGNRRPLRSTENTYDFSRNPVESSRPTTSYRKSSHANSKEKMKSVKERNQERSQEGDEVEQEWMNWNYNEKIQRCEQKCRMLNESLQMAVSNEKVARRKKAYYQRLCEEMERKNMRMRVELEQLRTTAYGLQMELQRSRMLLSQRDDFCSSLCRQALNNSWFTAQSKRLVPNQCQHQNASPCHHTFASMLSNTATPSSTNNDIRGGVGMMGPMSQLPLNTANASTSHMDGGRGGGEGLAEVSLSSLGLVDHNNHHELGNIDRLISSLNVNQRSETDSQYDVVRAATMHSCAHEKLLTVKTASDENGSDEVKNFRRQHQDSFSGSSSRPATRFDSETSSLEIQRGTKSGHNRGDLSALQVSASCDACLNSTSILRGSSGLLIKDDGYSTSGTLQSSLIPNAVRIPLYEELIGSSLTLTNGTQSSHVDASRRRSNSA